MWLQTKVHTKVRNHGEGLYYGLLLVESAYQCFHTLDNNNGCLNTVSRHEIGTPGQSNYHKGRVALRMYML